MPSGVLRGERRVGQEEAHHESHQAGGAVIAKVKNQVPSAITPAVEPSVLSAATSLQQPPPVIEAATLDPTIPLDPEHDWTDLTWIQDMLKLATDGTTRMDTN